MLLLTVPFFVLYRIAHEYFPDDQIKNVKEQTGTTHKFAIISCKRTERRACKLFCVSVSGGKEKVSGT